MRLLPPPLLALAAAPGAAASFLPLKPHGGATAFIQVSSRFHAPSSSSPPTSKVSTENWVGCRFTHLEAKTSAGKKKRNSKASRGGGFGKPVVSTSKGSPSDTGGGSGEGGDYDVYPALEESVQATLVPSDDGGSSSGDLSIEIYDRLAQIYSFDRFNYGGIGAAPYEDGQVEKRGASEIAAASVAEEEAPSMSFDDLLSSSGDGGSDAASSTSDFGDLLRAGGTSSSGSSAGTLDLDDLIASASGGAPPSSSTSAPSPPPPKAERHRSSSISALSSLEPFSKFHVLHVDPMVLEIDDFFTSDECDAYVERAATASKKKKGKGLTDDAPMEIGQSRTVGKDSRSQAQRTSTTWFNHYRGVPELMAKASRLLGLNGIERWEEPQTVRYRKTEKFTWHLDALAPSGDLKGSGGQRCATLLVYLTDLPEGSGGATMFRDLGGPGIGPLKVLPKKGSALLFFPAAGGIPNVPFDIRTLHCGEAVSAESQQDKWIAQLWLREGPYTPTAPPGNTHDSATDSISQYCVRK